MHIAGLLGVCLLAMTTGAAIAAESANLVTSRTISFSKGITGELEQVVAKHRGVMGVYVKHLKTQETFKVNHQELFPTASTIKLPVMCTALQLLADGTGPYSGYYDTRAYDSKTSTGGSGFIRNYKDGTKLELKELVHLMMTVSDNIATNMICDWIGLEKVNDWLIAKGFEQTRMFSTVGGGQIFDAEGRTTWGLGVTTPEEMGRLMELIVIGKAGTTSTTDEMLRILGHQYFDDGIAASIPPMTYVGSKSGALNQSRSDVAVVASPGGNYVLSVYTKENADRSWENSNEADAAIRKVSRIVFRHFNPKSEWEPAPGTENF